MIVYFRSRIMPSISHEALVSLFRDCPALGPELLRQRIGIELTLNATPHLTSAAFVDLFPPEYRADAVVLLEKPDGTVGEVVIVEVQIDRNSKKRYAWPYYATAARARYRCSATMLVIATDEDVATWAKRPIALDRIANQYIPAVLGPSAMPKIIDFERANAIPELAVLSAVAHGQGDSGEAIGRAAVSACKGLDDERQALYTDLVLASLNEAARRALEAFMNLKNYEFQSEPARRWSSFGRKRERQQVLERLLAQKFGELPDDLRERIRQAEMDDLERWLDRVIPANRLDDVFSLEPLSPAR